MGFAACKGLGSIGPQKALQEPHHTGDQQRDPNSSFEA